LATNNDSSPTAKGATDGTAHAELQVDGVAMVRLLGPQDRLLTTIEHQFPQVTVLVRGNQVTLEGPADEVAAAERLVSELILLVMPKTARYANIGELSAADPQLLAEIVGTARNLAEQHANGQFRLVFNSGEDAGQTVFHVHAHVLTGGTLEEGSLGQL
jgi:histidine triad (HIT) family protein